MAWDGRSEKDAEKKTEPVVTKKDLKIEFYNPQCHPTHNGKEIAIIGARWDPSIYLVKNEKGRQKINKVKGWKYPFKPLYHTVVKMSDHADHSQFISFGGFPSHLDRMSVYPKTNEVDRVNVYDEMKDTLPEFGRHPRGIFVNECGWSHLIVTGGFNQGHEESITMIHFPSQKVTHFKGVLPSDFFRHIMMPLSSFLSPNTLGFVLIEDKTTLQCVYKKDEDKWDFKKLKEPPQVEETWVGAGAALVQDKWIIGVGGYVGDGCSSRSIRIYDIPRNEWKVSPVDLPKGLQSIGACIVGTDLHVIGGQDESYGVQSSDQIIPLSLVLGDEWRPPPMQNPVEWDEDEPIRLQNPLVICICIESYSERPPWEDLPGAGEDKEIMIDLFTKVCGYSKSNLFFNFKKRVTKSDWDAIIVSAKERIWSPQSTVDGLIFYFAGHGESNGRLRLSDGSIETIRDLQAKFDGQSCEKLVGRPKIMVFACCRGVGGLADRAEDKRRRGPVAARWENATGNFMSLFPTAEGFQVFDPAKGSYISRAFQQVFKKHDLESVHFQDLWMKVSRVHEKSAGFRERMNIHSSVHRHVYLK